MANVEKKWHAENDKGNGWAPAVEEIDIELIEEAEEAEYMYTEDQVYVFSRKDGSVFGVGDANGPWAVDLIDKI